MDLDTDSTVKQEEQGQSLIDANEQIGVQGQTPYLGSEKSSTDIIPRGLSRHAGQRQTQITQMISGLQSKAERLSALQNKKRSSNEGSQTFQLPQASFTPYGIIRREEKLTSQSEKSSFSNRLLLQQSKMRKLNEESQNEYNNLMTEYENNSLETLLDQLKETEAQQEKFKRIALEQQQTEFMENTEGQIVFLQTHIENLYKSIHQINMETYSKINNNVISTQKLFKWYHSQLNNEQDTQAIFQQKTDQTMTDFSNAIVQFDNILDLILNQLENDKTDTGLERKLVSINRAMVTHVQRQVSNLQQLIIENKKDCNNDLNDVEQKFSQQLLHSQVLQGTSSQNDSQLQAKINLLEERIKILTSKLDSVDRMSQVAYYQSNVLVDQDKQIKVGMQESSSKQAQMLDLMTQSNRIMQDQIQDPVQRSNIEKRFKDSVQSLNLQDKVKLNFSQVDKIQEFMEYKPTNNDDNERMQTDYVAYDPHYQQYKQNMSKFFDKFPKESIYFMQKQGDVGTSKRADSIDFQALVDSLKDDTKDTPRVLFRNKNPSINISSGIKPDIPTRDSNIKSTKLNESPIQHDKSNFVHTTNQNKYYAKFNFREKYSKNVHPKMFLLQFETIAEQYQLSDQQKSQQFMFTLQNEYLDWYKARVLAANFNLSWDSLKLQFIQTYSKSDDEAREELYAITQKYNETPEQFLQRLRTITQTSNLTDDDVKRQFCTGLQSLQARQYITYMKQFNEALFKKHTTTTLMQELDKQAQRFKFSLTSSSSPPKDTRATTRYTYSKDKTSSPRRDTYRPDTYRKDTYKPNDTNNKEKREGYKTTYKPTQSAKRPQANNVQENQVPQESNNIQETQQQNQFEESQSTFDYDPATDFHESQRSISEHDDDCTVAIAGPSVPIDYVNNVSSTPEIQAGEGEQVHSLFRKNQKNSNEYADKLVELARKGKELPQTNYKYIRNLQYIHLPEAQLLTEAPQQFISACSYISQCLHNKSNLLNNEFTTRNFNKFQESLSLRFAEISNDDRRHQGDGNEQVNYLNMVHDQNNAIVQVSPVDYLHYINVAFEGKQVMALLDTGSSVTVISENFCNKQKIQIPTCKTKREVTLADGSKVEMKEWKDARISLDKYVSILCDVLISKSTSYDLLLGLNICCSIGASLQNEYLRYSIIVNEKERFGKIPIVRSGMKNKK